MGRGESPVSSRGTETAGNATPTLEPSSNYPAAADVIQLCIVCVSLPCRSLSKELCLFLFFFFFFFFLAEIRPTVQLTLALTLLRAFAISRRRRRRQPFSNELEHGREFVNARLHRRLGRRWLVAFQKAIKSLIVFSSSLCLWYGCCCCYIACVCVCVCGCIIPNGAIDIGCSHWPAFSPLLLLDLRSSQTCLFVFYFQFSLRSFLFVFLFSCHHL